MGEGLSTMVLPASRAGAILKKASATGKFHGTMAPTTPMGTRCTCTSESGASTSVVGSSGSLATSAHQ